MKRNLEYRSKVSCSWSHTALVTDDDEFITWGSGHHNQLGFGDMYTSVCLWQLPKILKAINKRGGGQAQVDTSPYASYFLVGGTLFYCGASFGTVLSGLDTSNDVKTMDFIRKGEQTAIGGFSVGLKHAIAISQDGYTLFFWGETEHCLDMDSVERIITVPIPLPIKIQERIVQVACGSKHTLFLTEIGDVYSLGYGGGGRLGTGDTRSRKYPVRIKYLGYSSSHVVIQIVAGESHSLALTDEGIVLSWGSGNFGRLGHGQEIDHLIPKVIVGLANVHVWFIACNAYHSLAITNLVQDLKQSSMYIWGCGMHGKLGNGSSENALTPIQVAYFAKNRVQITQASCGLHFTTAISSEGSVYSWGLAESLRCGLVVENNECEDQYIAIPTKIIIEKPHSFISGDSTSLELRINKFAEKIRRSRVSSLSIRKIACGNSHNLALSGNSNVFAWGGNSFGQLGTGGGSEYCPRPVSVKFEVLVGSDVFISDIACGDFHSLALGSQGSLYAWGSNQYGQLGNGAREHNNIPVLIEALQGTYLVRISAGGRHSAAIGTFADNDEFLPSSKETLHRGRLFMWGSNEFGQLGLAKYGGNEHLPKSVNMPSANGIRIAIDVSLGSNHSLVVFQDRVAKSSASKGELYSCGLGKSGQLGLASTQNYSTFQAVHLDSDGDWTITQIEAGGDNSMVLLGNHIWIWGRQLGFSESPGECILDPLDCRDVGIFKNKVLRGVSCNKDHCIVRGSAYVIAWGSNKSGKLGVDYQQDKIGILPPQLITGDWNKSIVQVHCAEMHSMALIADGKVYSWGNVKGGRLGQGDETLDSVVLTNTSRPAVIRSLSEDKSFRIISNLGVSSSMVVLGEEDEDKEDVVDIDQEFGDYNMLDEDIIIPKLRATYVEKLHQLVIQEQQQAYYLQRTRSAVFNRIKSDYSHMPNDFFPQHFSKLLENDNILIPTSSTVKSIWHKTKGRKRSQAVEQHVNTKFSIKYLIMKIYMHPCFISRLFDVVVELKYNEQVLHDLVYTLWDPYKKPDMYKIQVVIKKILEKHVRFNQNEDPLPLFILNGDSLAYQICIRSLFFKSPVKHMLLSLIYSWEDKISRRMQESSSILNPDQVLAELAGIIMQDIYSSKKKRMIQSELGWLIGYLVEQLRLVTSNYHVLTAQKFFKGLLEFTQDFYFSNKTIIVGKGLDEDGLSLFKKAIRLIKSKLKVDKDASTWVVEEKVDLSLSRLIQFYGEWWKDTHLEEFVIDISENTLDQDLYHQKMVELVATDHIVNSLHGIFLKKAHLDLLSNPEISQKWINTSLESILPNTIQLPLYVKYTTDMLTDETSEMEPLQSCPVCNLWVPSHTLQMNIVEEEMDERKVLGSNYSTTGMQRSMDVLEEDQDKLSNSHQMPVLECWILYRLLKKAMEKTYGSVNASSAPTNGTQSLEDKLRKELHNEEITMIQKLTASDKPRRRILVNFRALKRVIRIVGAIIHTLNAQILQRESREKKQKICPVELRRGKVAFFTASVSGPHSLSVMSSDGTVTVDSVLQKLGEALEVIVMKDLSNKNMMKREKLLYDSVIEAVGQREAAINTEINSFRDSVIRNLTNGITHPSLIRNAATFETGVQSRVFTTKVLKTRQKIGYGWRKVVSYNHLVQHNIIIGTESSYAKLKKILRKTSFLFTSTPEPGEFRVQLLYGKKNRVLFTDKILFSMLMNNFGKHYIECHPKEKDSDVIPTTELIRFIFDAYKLTIELETIPRPWS